MIEIINLTDVVLLRDIEQFKKGDTLRIDWNLHNSEHNITLKQGDFFIYGFLKKSKTLIEITDIAENTSHFRTATCFVRCSDNVKYASKSYDEYYKYPSDFKVRVEIKPWVEHELSEQEAIDILLNEVLYGCMPSLRSTSCVGTNIKGIDKDPNYHNGSYTLINGKTYSITYCGDSVYIYNNRGNGWYGGKKEDLIYKGFVDYERIKTAKIHVACMNEFDFPIWYRETFPNAYNEMFEYKSKFDCFKLNYEFENEK